jgi:alpha-L-fucosidase
VPAGDWGVTTQTEDRIYVHILNWAAPLLALPPIQAHISAAKALSDGSPLEFRQSADGVILKVPPPQGEEADRVIVLTLQK